MRTERLAARHGLDLAWVHFPLHPEIPLEGMALAELFAGRTDVLKNMHARLKSLMEAEGLPYSERTMTYNSRLAQELGCWGDEHGVEAIHDALFRAYFVDNLNLADPDVLVTIADGVGLDGDEAREVLSSRRFRDRVDADWRRSREIGVTGVPTFVFSGRGVVGAQPYEVLERLVESSG